MENENHEDDRPFFDWIDDLLDHGALSRPDPGKRRSRHAVDVVRREVNEPVSFCPIRGDRCFLAPHCKSYEIAKRMAMASGVG